MKAVVLLCVFAVVGYSVAAPNEVVVHPRGCIYILGRCSQECEEGTHAFTTGCGYKTPEATCDEPNPVEDTRGMICDYSACYCDAPTVRDSKSGKCVQLADCPKKE